ncbi:hypothetical protein [Sorangium sp. So ce388]|uniref:hypothetical protein n=1 Tax=Sorangium sp. So ce388 TaxID=3133309 RepID=UPI003F5BCEEC
MTDLLPSLRALRDAAPRDTAERDTLTRAVAELERRVRPTFQEQVTEFHRALDFPVRDTPTVPDDDEVRLRARLIAEEAFEVLAAMFPVFDWDNIVSRVRYVVEAARVGPVDLPALAHELADLHYVTSGTAVQLGFDERAVLNEVHRANLSKFGAGKDHRGKALKGSGFVPADVAAVLRAQGWQGGEELR